MPPPCSNSRARLRLLAAGVLCDTHWLARDAATTAATTTAALLTPYCKSPRALLDVLTKDGQFTKEQMRQLHETLSCLKALNDRHGVEATVDDPNIAHLTFRCPAMLQTSAADRMRAIDNVVLHAAHHATTVYQHALCPLILYEYSRNTKNDNMRSEWHQKCQWSYAVGTYVERAETGFRHNVEKMELVLIRAGRVNVEKRFEYSYDGVLKCMLSVLHQHDEVVRSKMNPLQRLLFDARYMLHDLLESQQSHTIHLEELQSFKQETSSTLETRATAMQKTLKQQTHDNDKLFFARGSMRNAETDAEEAWRLVSKVFGAYLQDMLRKALAADKAAGAAVSTTRAKQIENEGKRKAIINSDHTWKGLTFEQQATRLKKREAADAGMLHVVFTHGKLKRTREEQDAEHTKTTEAKAKAEQCVRDWEALKRSYESFCKTHGLPSVAMQKYMKKVKAVENQQAYLRPIVQLFENHVVASEMPFRHHGDEFQDQGTFYAYALKLLQGSTSKAAKKSVPAKRPGEILHLLTVWSQYSVEWLQNKEQWVKAEAVLQTHEKKWQTTWSRYSALVQKTVYFKHYEDAATDYYCFVVRAEHGDGPALLRFSVHKSKKQNTETGWSMQYDGGLPEIDGSDALPVSRFLRYVEGEWK